jgi:hypothetical protein
MKMTMRISFVFMVLCVVALTIPFASLIAAEAQSSRIEKQMEVTIIHVDKYGVYAPSLIFYWDPGMNKQKVSAMTGIAEQLRNKGAWITYSTTTDTSRDKRPLLVDIVPSRQEVRLTNESPVMSEPVRPTRGETQSAPPVPSADQPKPGSLELALPKPSKDMDPNPVKQTPSGSTAISRAEVVNFVRGCIDAMQSKNVERAVECYGDRVDYYSKGVVNRDFITRDKGYYYRNWDRISSSIDGDIVLIVIDQPDLRIAKFNSRFHVQNAKNTVSGRAENIWKLQKIGNELKIVDEKQKIIERDER